MIDINELILKNKQNDSVINLKAMIENDKIYFDAYHASDLSMINLDSLKDDDDDDRLNFLNCLNNTEDIKKTLIRILKLLINKFKIENLKVTGIDDATDILKLDVVLSALLKTPLTSIEIIKA